MKKLSMLLALVLMLMMLCSCSSAQLEDPLDDNPSSQEGNSTGDSLPAQLYTVDFDSQGGTELDSITTSYIDSIPQPTMAGYNLEGWYSDSSYTDKVAFPYDPTGDTTLYAQWIPYTDGLAFGLEDEGYYVTDQGTALDGGNSDIVVPSHYNDVAVVGVADRAFMGDSVTSVVLPYTVTSIGSWAFGGCASLTSVILPDYLDSIDMGAFFNDKLLTDIQLPSTVTTIAKSVFSNCTALTAVVVPDSVSYLGDSAFAFCSNLATVTLPSNLESVGAWLLSGTSISSIDLPDTVTYIGDYALSNCTNLTAVTLPASLEKIKACAFMGCSNLDSVVFNSNGWYVTYSYLFEGGDAVDTSDSTLNATRLVSVDNYYDYNWYRV